jgi:hypothetical protein
MQEVVHMQSNKSILQSQDLILFALMGLGLL